MQPMTPDEARQVLKEAVAALSLGLPGEAAWWRYREGEARMALGQWEAAIGAFRAAFDLYPPGASRERAEVLGRLGRSRHLLGDSGGEGDLREAVRLDPHRAQLHADLGDCLLARKAWAPAAGAYARALELEPGNADYAAARERALAIAEKLAKGPPAP